jgi:MFS family permease
LLAAFGFVLSVFSPNVLFLYFSLGIVAGFGFGLIYLPSVVAINVYFDRRRSLATGLAVCGSGVGTIVFALLVGLLLDEYGWRGTLLIEAGIVLNCCACGLIFLPLHPVPPSPSPPAYLPGTDLPSTPSTALSPRTTGNNTYCFETDEQRNVGDGEGLQLLTGNGKAAAEVNGCGITSTRGQGHGRRAEGQWSDDDRAPADVVALCCDDDAIKDDDVELFFNPASQRLTSSKCSLDANCAGKLDDKQVGGALAKSSSNSNSLRRLEEAQLVSEPVQDLSPSWKCQLDSAKDSKILNVDRTCGVEKDHEDKANTAITSCCCCSTCTNPRWSNQYFDLTILASPVFLLFAASNVLSCLGYSAPYVFLPDIGRVQAGLDDDRSALLVSVVGLSNTVMRVAFGCVGDLPCVNRLALYGSVLTVSGLTSTFVVYYSQFALLVVYSAIFGTCMGVYTCMLPIVLVDLFGVNKLSDTFGAILFCCGVGTAVGTPIAGWLFDYNENYGDSFLFAGLTMTASGLIVFALPWLQRRRRHLHDDEQQRASAATDCRCTETT